MEKHMGLPHLCNKFLCSHSSSEKRLRRYPAGSHRSVLLFYFKPENLTLKVSEKIRKLFEFNFHLYIMCLEWA